MSANTIKGNNTGSTSNSSDLNASQVTAMLNNVVGDSGSGGTKGLVPAPAVNDAAAGKFLKADGTWSVPAGGNVVNRFFRSIKFSAGVLTALQLIPLAGSITNWGSTQLSTKRINIGDAVLQVGGFTNTTTDVTIPVAGNYMVTFSFTTFMASYSRHLFCQLVKTTAGVSSVVAVSGGVVTSTNVTLPLSIDYIGAFSANDVLDVRVETPNGTETISITSYSVCIQQIV